LSNSEMVWDKIKPLLKSIRFVAFLAFGLLNGLLSAVLFVYIFV